MHRTSKISALVAALAAFSLLFSGMALADDVVNDVTNPTETLTVSRGSTGTVQFQLVARDGASGNPDADGCNATTDKPVRVNIAIPASATGVTASQSFVTFTACAVYQSVTFAATSTAAGGNHAITAAVDGAINGVASSKFNTAPAAFTLNVPSATATALAVDTASGTFGDSATLSATLTAGGAGVSGKTINFTLNGSPAGSAVTNSSGVASHSASLSGINASTYANGVAASFTADSTHAGSNGSNTLTVAKANQSTLVVTDPSSGTYGQKLAMASSGGSGGGAVTYDVTGSACAVVGSGPDAGKLEITAGSGTCSITATKAASTNYNSTTSVAHPVTVGKAAQAALSITAPTNGTFGETLTMSTTGGTGNGGVSYETTNDTNACTIGNTDQLSITSGVGICKLRATKAATDNYESQTSSVHTVTVQKANQPTLTITSPDSGKYDELLTIATSGGAGGGDLSFAVSDDSTACTISSGKLRITAGSGLCEVTAHKAGTDNYNSTSSAVKTVAVSKASANISLSSLAKTYNGDAQGATATTTPSGLGTVTITYDGGSAVPSDAGSYAVVASLDNANYEADNAIGTLVISPKAVTGSFTTANKEYDGNTSAAAAGRSLTGVESIDAGKVALSGGTASFDTKNVGTGKTVTLSGAALSGVEAGNYTLGSVDTQTANITAKSITGSFTTANKEYDGNTSSAAAGRSLTGVESIDAGKVALSGGTASFDTKNVGTGKTVTLSGAALSGIEAGNYTLGSVDTQTANITVKSITGSFETASRVYNGTTSADATNRSLTGVESIDAGKVALSGGTASFDTKNVGTGKTVTLSGAALSGVEAGNYTLGSVDTQTAGITALGVSGTFVPDDKEWDGTTAATFTSPTVIGAVSGDAVSLAGGTATFLNAAVGTWAVTGSGFELSGTDAGNYALGTVTATRDANITAAFDIEGFYRPVDMTPTDGPKIYQPVKNGSTTPLKFRVFRDGAEVTDATNMAVFVSRVTCETGVVAPDDLAPATGGTSLRYDTTSGQFVYNWAVAKGANLCYQLTVRTADGNRVMTSSTGTVHEAFFKTK